jgi:hypothetical protein
MSYYIDFGKGIDTLMNIMLIGLIVFVPLGMWKLIEICIWLFPSCRSIYKMKRSIWYEVCHNGNLERF